MKGLAKLRPSLPLAEQCVYVRARERVRPRSRVRNANVFPRATTRSFISRVYMNLSFLILMLFRLRQLTMRTILDVLPCAADAKKCALLPPYPFESRRRVIGPHAHLTSCRPVRFDRVLMLNY